MSALSAAAVLVPLLVIGTPPAGSATVTVEQVVQRHLDWLNARPNYSARVIIDDGKNVAIGTLLVDTRSRRTQLLLHSEGLPKKVYIKATRKDDTTQQLAYSLGPGRKDDLPFAEHTFEGLRFPDGGYDLFVAGQDLAATMARMRLIAEDLSVKPRSILGEHGLRIALRKTLLDQLGAAADRFLAGSNAPPVQPPDVLMLWFGQSGEIDAVQVEDTGGSLNLEVRFEYDVVEETPPPTSSPGTQGTVPEHATTPRAAADRALDVAQVVEPVFDNRALFGLSVVLGLLSVGVVFRLRRRQPRE